MTYGNQLLARLRVLLGDSQHNNATGGRFYEDATLLLCLNNAVQDTLKGTQPTGGQPEIGLIQSGRFPITTGPLVKSCAATAGTQIPDDFWMLEAGYTSAGQFVQPADVADGRFYADNPFAKTIYVEQNTFKGQADSALYWRVPPKITAAISLLPMFSDAFFNVIKLRAARDAVYQEDRDALDRWKYLDQEFHDALLSLG